jgi:hypothetical protein
MQLICPLFGFPDPPNRVVPQRGAHVHRNCAARCSEVKDGVILPLTPKSLLRCPRSGRPEIISGAKRRGQPVVGAVPTVVR